MKKAIVIAITMMLGLGLTAFAGPLSGSWASSLVIDPAASSFTSLSSTLAVDYTVSGWTFGSSSSFTLTGFSSQSFTAGGSFGAFTLSSTMTFDPMAVTAKDYTAFWDALTVAPTQTFETTICPITLGYTTTTEPKFLTWKTEGSVSIGGVELGVLFYIDQSHFDVIRTNYLTRIDSDVQTTSYVCTSKDNGSGWRFKVAGSIGGITATSYTYFNLTEADVKATYCPEVGKRGVFSIANPDCAPAFTEEYITLEGFALGCATIDVGISIDCDGFADLTFVASDVAIGDWLELDFGLKFTTTTKSTDFCFVVAMPESDCLTIEFGLNGSPNPNTTGVIDSIDFYGIGFSYDWDGITFASYTEISPYSKLISGSTDYAYIYNSTTNSFLVPYAGRSGDCTATAATATYYEVVDGWYELQCVYTERYRLWEKFVIDIDGDACCGGALDLTISTWFGDYEELAWYAYYVYEKTTVTTPVIANVTWLLSGETAALANGFVIADEFAKATATTYKYAQGVAISPGYATPATAVTTLFNWAQTEVDASVGVASNITLDLGFNVSAFGWESLEVGFTFVF